MANQHHPDCGDPEAQVLLQHEIERQRHVQEREAPGVQPAPEVNGEAVKPRGDAQLGRVEPQKIEEVDLLRYQLLGARVQHQKFLIEMYEREAQRAQIDLTNLTQDVAKHVNHLGEKYKVDMGAVLVTEDGYLVPRQKPVRSNLMKP